MNVYNEPVSEDTDMIETEDQNEDSLDRYNYNNGLNRDIID